MNTLSHLRRIRTAHLHPKAAPGLCRVFRSRLQWKGHAFRNVFRNAFRISQIVFFGAHTPQEYHR